MISTHFDLAKLEKRKSYAHKVNIRKLVIIEIHSSFSKYFINRGLSPIGLAFLTRKCNNHMESLLDPVH